MMATRIYAVQGLDTFRLIEAGSKQAAIRHAAKGVFSAEVANQKTLVAAMQDGVRVEAAVADKADSEE
jgi:hypothetical protein